MRPTLLIPVVFYCLLTATMASDSWPQASGPNADWKVEGTAPTHWSVVRNENILWRTPMPESGQSAVTLSGDRAFVTIHKPIDKFEDRFLGSDIIGYCLDANTGKILWKVDLPGTQTMEMSCGFSDATVFAPVTDGEHVWFFNRCGSMGCYDFDGKEVWLRTYKMRFRHSARSCEPILLNGQILNVEVADKETGALITKFVPGTSNGQKAVIPEGIDQKTVWTYVHGIDATTGKVLWRENVGTSIHDAPMIGRLADGTPAIVHARGGGHGPLEKPYGLSLTSLQAGETGKTLWSTEFAGMDPPFNNHWNQDEVYTFHKGDHVVLDSKTGAVIRRQPIYKGADFWLWDNKKNDWVFEKNVAKATGKAHPMTYHSNNVVGDWHWFMAHKFPYISRVNVKTGKVEYLEVPAQLDVSKKTRKDDTHLWGKGLKNKPTNAKGFPIGRKGHDGIGFGHLCAGTPILVGKHLIFPAVTGTVYVIDTTVETLSPKSLVAVNDLGISGETWTLSSFSYANGKLYMHTMREVICIAAE
ncbi:PQQ-like beta-propeller repeat protein [Verrucomicrobia bacterium]|nr:PQQ-like beta-propeller repeat protein [Verrucomicrobiota bacterium]